jgi:hypothetical protein
MLLNPAEKRLQNKPYTTDKAQASSTKGRDLIRAKPRARTVVLDGFTPHPRIPSVSRCTLGSPKVQSRQALAYNDLVRIALPTDRITCSFNAGIA